MRKSFSRNKEKEKEISLNAEKERKKTNNNRFTILPLPSNSQIVTTSQRRQENQNARHISCPQSYRHSDFLQVLPYVIIVQGSAATSLHTPTTMAHSRTSLLFSSMHTPVASKLFFVSSRNLRDLLLLLYQYITVYL